MRRTEGFEEKLDAENRKSTCKSGDQMLLHKPPHSPSAALQTWDGQSGGTSVLSRTPRMSTSSVYSRGEKPEGICGRHKGERPGHRRLKRRCSSQSTGRRLLRDLHASHVAKLTVRIGGTRKGLCAPAHVCCKAGGIGCRWSSRRAGSRQVTAAQTSRPAGAWPDETEPCLADEAR